MRISSDDDLRGAIAGAQQYTAVILKAGPNYASADAPDIIWEHGRRNFGLRADGVQAIVLPVPDDSEVCGIGVFAATVEQTDALMAEDPGVLAGVFTYEAHQCLGFPGDALPPARDV